MTLPPDASGPTHVATVSFAHGPKAVWDLHDAIGRRHSNRGPCTDEPVSADVLSTLDELTAGLDDISIRWCNTPAEQAKLGTVIIAATQAIVVDEEQSTESFAWFRNTRDDIDTHNDGLTLDAQAMSPMVLAADVVEAVLEVGELTVGRTPVSRRRFERRSGRRGRSRRARDRRHMARQ